MPFAMVPIYTQTVGAGGASSVVFNNIPSIYSDLKLVISTRFTGTGTNPYFGFLLINPNGSGTNYSETYLNGNGSTAISGRFTTNGAWLMPYRSIPNSSTTANTFSNTEVYIPNYTRSVFKQALVDGVGEFNLSAGGLTLQASLWRDTSPINSIIISGYLDNASWGVFSQHSTFTLYGIKNA